MAREILLSKNVQEVLIIKCGIGSILEEFIEIPLDLIIHVSRYYGSRTPCFHETSYVVLC